MTVMPTQPVLTLTVATHVPVTLVSKASLRALMVGRKTLDTAISGAEKSFGIKLSTIAYRFLQSRFNLTPTFPLNQVCFSFAPLRSGNETENETNGRRWLRGSDNFAGYYVSELVFGLTFFVCCKQGSGHCIWIIPTIFYVI